MTVISRLLTLALALYTSIALAHAQAFPNRSIHIIVPFGPGGGTDTVARLLASGMQEALGGPPIIVENRPGAGTVVGASAAARALPDGYTLMVTLDQTFTMNPFLYDNLPYDPVHGFSPISLLAIGPLVYVVNPHVPARTLPELIAYAKSNPGTLNVSSGAISGQVTSADFMDATGTKMVFVPYSSGPQALTALLANDVQFVIADIGTFAPSVRSGSLVGLAVSGSHRSQLLPDVPTLRELGLSKIDSVGWWGLFAPAGTPKPIIAALNAAALKAMANPEVRQKIAATGNEVMTSSPQEVTEMMQQGQNQWGPVIKKSGIKAN